MGRVREGTSKKHEPRTTVAQGAAKQHQKDLVVTPLSGMLKKKKNWQG